MSTTEPTLMELLDDAADRLKCGWYKCGEDGAEACSLTELATRLRAAAARLRTEIAVWREVEPGMAYTGEVVNRCLARINGGPLPTNTPTTGEESSR